MDDACGARLASLHLGGHEVLQRGDQHDDPLRWGAYPMAPWAGRLRNGHLIVEGTPWQVRGAGMAGDHPLHGTIADRPWQVTEHSERSVTCTIDLGERWPLPGRVTHRIVLEAHAVTCELTLIAGPRAFPAQVGWHPWFTAPWTRQVGFRGRYRRDHEVLPTGDLDPEVVDALGPEPRDDCFVGPRWPPRLVHPDGGVLEITSDCSHWVVYDEPGHAVCIEPQSGPPDGAHLEPVVLPPGGSLRRFMRIAAVP